MNLHLIRYQVTGLNFNNLFNLLKKEGIILYKIRLKSQKVVEFSIPFRKKEKFFAIIKDLCYNTRYVKEYGILYPLKKFSKKLGAILGVVIFLVTSFISNFLILDIDYYGSGAIYKSQASEVLSSLNVTKYSFVRQTSFRNVERKILNSTHKFSFVSIKKRGTRLKVNLVLSPDVLDIIDTTKFSLLSTVDGVVESIKVYRGTAQVGVGDTVRVGDKLIDGYNIIKDVKVETYVLGVVTIVCENNFTFEGEEGQEEKVLLLAKENLPDADIIEENCTYIQGIYLVSIKYKIKLT